MTSTATVNLTAKEAVLRLTLGETGAICRHYGAAKMSQLVETDALAGTIWAHRRRRDPAVSWADIEAMTLTEATEFFEPEAAEVDPDDPETPAGKG